MNTQQASKLTNIPVSVLVRMRARQTMSIKSGPPFRKKMNKNGELIYEYNRVEVLDWLRHRVCLITAGDAAEILSVPREEILKYSGVQSKEIKTKEYRGKLVIDNGKNIYIWVPKGKLPQKGRKF